MWLTCRRDVWTLRNTRHSKADRWSQFKANCWTMEPGFNVSSQCSGMFCWQAALSLPASCSPYRAMHPGWGRETAGFTACPAPTISQPELQLELRTQPTLLLCEERERREGYASSFKQHGTSSVRRPTLHSWHLVQSRSAFTLGKQSNTDFESFKPCLPTLILTSSPPRRTQLVESNSIFASNSTLAKSF